MKTKSIKELLEFGFICIDKPSGPTSHSVSEYVKDILGLRKASHLGTLDPAVSGVLPIALNRACRLSTYLMRKNKQYVGIMRLHEDMSRVTLEKEMKHFVGKISQLPPVRSNVRRALRTREIMRFDLIEKEGIDVLFETDVEAGTYIRTLIHDLGKKIGGAHMLELRRTQAGIFDEHESHTLYELEEAIAAYKKGNEKLLLDLIVPAEKVVKESMSFISVKTERLSQLLTGKPIHRRDLISPCTLEKNTFVAVFCGERFIEIARVVHEGDTIAVPDFVLN